MKKLPIPSNLLTLRETKSQAEIGRLLGVSQVTVSNWLRGPEQKEPYRQRSGRQNRIKRFGFKRLEHYQRRLKEQYGLCDLCGVKMSQPHQDHDHFCCPSVKDYSGRSRNKVCGECLRGLICNVCNQRLAYVEEILLEVTIPKKFKWFYLAQRYLKKWRRLTKVRGPETRIRKKIQKQIQTEYPRAYFRKIHGGPMQNKGIADLLGCVDGFFFALEVKVPGRKATPAQLLEGQKVLNAHGVFGVVTSPDEALSLIRRGLEWQQKRIVKRQVKK